MGRALVGCVLLLASAWASDQAQVLQLEPVTQAPVVEQAAAVSEQAPLVEQPAQVVDPTPAKESLVALQKTENAMAVAEAPSSMLPSDGLPGPKTINALQPEKIDMAVDLAQRTFMGLHSDEVAEEDEAVDVSITSTLTQANTEQDKIEEMNNVMGNQKKSTYHVSFKNTPLRKVAMEIPSLHWLDQNAIQVDNYHSVPLEELANVFNAAIRPCDPYCAVGKFKAGCHHVYPGECVDCSPIPPNATYLTQGLDFKDKCEWGCNYGSYKNMDREYTGPTGIVAEPGEWVDDGSPNCTVCAECPVGKYRAGCSGLNAGVCIPCTTLPFKHAYYTSSGSLGIDNCEWACNAGHVRVGDDCPEFPQYGLTDLPLVSPSPCPVKAPATQNPDEKRDMPDVA